MTRTGSLIVMFGLIVVASLGLYRTSNQVQELEHELRSVNAGIDSERENMHVLKAEWVYLANPARIEAVAKKHLDLRPTAPKQISSLNDIGGLVPSRAEAIAAIDSAKPVAQKVASDLHQGVTTLRTAMATLPQKAEALVHRKPKAPETVASTGPYLHDHIALERTASVQPDSISAMLDRLNGHQ